MANPLEGTNSDNLLIDYVEFAFRHLLNRMPRPDETENWTARMRKGLSEGDVFRKIVESKEFKAKSAVVPGHLPGHFYSPVVDPNEVKPYWERSSSQSLADIEAIEIDLEAMNELWAANLPFLTKLDFSREKDENTRYYLSDRRYPPGDAFALAMMINALRPKKIIEIGSGFSSAAMLDVVDRLDLPSFRLTCIDPYADRLRSLMRPSDWSVVTLLEKKVQEVGLELFESLAENDILFIDSSHVLKTGSDVHYELFEILPRLKPGVVVHIHDIHFPFEYPREWIFNLKWSWNEIYALRLFLMYNQAFKVSFFTDLFLKQGRLQCKPSDLSPGLTNLVGGSLWMRRTKA